MLTAKQRDDWAAALRSGDYKQGRSRLRTINADGSIEWCCLGVLADVLDPDAWNGHTWGPFRNNIGLPFTILKIQSPFMDWNDNLHKTFAEIADEVDKLEVST